ncbi:UDP-N-acetylmuramoyl-tripeptide--D-alanyl-D-alanine ligase [Orbus sturtevantii]|uniref:UDP-N-acetylmuramoyl-tripeptide--D-alanyl-D- alanine ligase n=1 Tax=Orbus sturtevantii TaxID=3074109 RepID=UPI00370D045A
MIVLSIKQLQQIVDGQLIAIKDENALIDEISTDSRNIIINSLFIALIGSIFDGHSFAKKAVSLGAMAVLVNHKIDDEIPQIIVKDTHQALGQIAAWVRAQSTAKVVALTGSSGKTSVKEMTAAILSKCGKTLFTKGNFNNDIGVPLTLLRLTTQDEFAVIELGANHIGEIAYTTQLVKPQSALINNISEAHLEGFGSLAGVAKAKSEIFLGLPKGGTAIINLDSYSQDWLENLAEQKIYTFSLQQTTADFYASAITQSFITAFTLHTPIGEIAIHLPLLGLHNISNAIAASILAISVGANLNQVKSGLESILPVKGRLYPIPLNDHQLILDDSYNANVGSMTAAINVLAQQRGYRVFVVGDMAELGKDSEKLHQKIGEAAKIADLDCVISIGKNSAFISHLSGVGHHFSDKNAIVVFLKQILKEKNQVTILVKGSRSAKMEEIVSNLSNHQD